MSNFINNFLEAMDLIAEKKVQDAGYSRTVTAEVVSVGQAAGKYQIKLQDKASPSDANGSDGYAQGDIVSVLVSGDLNPTYTIVGKITQFTSALVYQGEEDKYDKIGGNMFAAQKEEVIELSGATTQLLDDYITINWEDLQEHLNEGRVLSLEFDFQPLIDTSGDYFDAEYKLVLTFETENSVTKEAGDNWTVTWGINDSTGDVYHSTNFVRQFVNFILPEGTDLTGISSISFSTKNLPSGNNNLFKIRDFSVYSQAIPADEGVQCKVSITDGRSYFADDGPESITLQVDIREDGVKVISLPAKTKITWFRENPMVDKNSPAYRDFAGEGWQYLSEAQVATNGLATLEKQQTKVLPCDITVPKINYKCFVEYQGKRYSSSIVLEQKNPDYLVDVRLFTTGKGVEPSWDETQANAHLGLVNKTIYAQTDTTLTGLEYQWTVIDMNNNRLTLENEKGESTGLDTIDVDASKLVGLSTYRIDYYIQADGIKTWVASAQTTLAPESKKDNGLILTGVAGYQYGVDGKLVTPVTTPLKIMYFVEGEDKTQQEIVETSAEVHWFFAKGGHAKPQKASGYISADTNTHYVLKSNGFAEIAYTLDTSYNKDKNPLTEVFVKVLMNGEWHQSSAITITVTTLGQPGTNGSDYVCLIQQGVGESAHFPRFIKGVTGSEIYFSPWFAHNSSPGVNLVAAGSSEEYKVSWHKWEYVDQVLNKKGILLSGSTLDATQSFVLQLTVELPDGKVYSCYTPVVIDIEGYEFDADSGYPYVLYSSNGENPSYYQDKFRLVEDNTSVIWTALAPDGIERTSPMIDQNQKPKARYLSEDPEMVFMTATIGEDEVAKVPVVFVRNAFENAAINGWDGSQVQVNSTEILSPLAGFGKKNLDNSFTGVMLGTVTSGETQNQGILGYNYGQRTFFLDAETGAAKFGVEGAGQIVLDPNDRDAQGRPRALIRGGNYVPHPDNETGEDKGSGMIIDLSTPMIEWGSGLFKVDEKGRLFAQSAKFQGDIEGSDIIGGTLQVGKGQDDATYYLRAYDKGSIRVQIGKLDSGISVDEQGNVFVSTKLTANSLIVGNKFNASVDNDTVSIGGFQVSDTTLFSGSGASYLGLNSDNGNNYAIWAGNESPTSANLAITYTGALIAKVGSFGPWELSTNGLQSKLNSESTLPDVYNNTTYTNHWFKLENKGLFMKGRTEGNALIGNYNAWTWMSGAGIDCWYSNSTSHAWMSPIGFFVGDSEARVSLSDSGVSGTLKLSGQAPQILINNSFGQSGSVRVLTSYTTGTQGGNDYIDWNYVDLTITIGIITGIVTGSYRDWDSNFPDG